MSHKEANNRSDIVAAKTKTLGKVPLKDDEEARISQLSQQLVLGKLGKDVASMARSIVLSCPGRPGTRCREVVEMPADSELHHNENRYTGVLGNDDEFFDRVNQIPDAGPENIVSLLFEMVSRRGEANGMEATIEEKIEAIMDTTVLKILGNQPFRLYMRCLFVIDGDYICQVHFDRCGATYTSPFNAHTDHDTFIRLVLSSTSSDIHIIGVDRNVKFKKEAGMKVGASIVLKDESGESVTYEMNPKPTHVEKARQLVGRATMCYELTRGGRRYALKTSWRTPELYAKEPLMLEKAKGTKAAAQMVSWDGGLTTNMLRGPSETEWSHSDETNGLPYYHRVLILIEDAGREIHEFKSEPQLVQALGNITRGIHHLHSNANIAHGDISASNARLGHPGAAAGERGKLIDFDMAIDANNENFSYHGTGPYMSLLTMLRLLVSQGLVYQGRHLTLLPHDSLDDLESLWRVFWHIMHGKESLSGELTGMPPILARYKTSFLEAYKIMDLYFTHNAEFNLRGVPAHWSPIIIRLFKRMYKFVRKIAQLKRSFVQGRGVEEPEYTAMKELIPTYMEEVQSYFEDALAEYATVDTPPPSPGIPTSAPTPDPYPSTDAIQAPRSPEGSASQRGLRSPLQPRIDQNHEADATPAVAKASPSRRVKRKASEVELENRPVPAKQRK